MTIYINNNPYIIMFVSLIVPMAAQNFLNKKIKEISDQVTEKYKPFTEDIIHRQIVDYVRALHKIRSTKKLLKDRFNINITPDIVQYLNDPDD